MVDLKASFRKGFVRCHDVHRDLPHSAEVGSATSGEMELSHVGIVSGRRMCMRNVRWESSRAKSGASRVTQESLFGGIISSSIPGPNYRLVSQDHLGQPT